MNKEYEKELKDLKEKMVGAEKLAEKFPCFKDYILKNKLTENNGFLSFGKVYKKLCLNWGIIRMIFDSNSNVNITNYKGKYSNKRLFKLYFNSLSLYDSNNDYGLDKLAKEDGVFFFDDLNTEFYIEEQYIGQFLDKANDWFIKAVKELKEERLKIRKKELEKELKALEESK